MTVNVEGEVSVTVVRFQDHEVHGDWTRTQTRVCNAGENFVALHVQETVRRGV